MSPAGSNSRRGARRSRPARRSTSSSVVPRPPPDAAVWTRDGLDTRRRPAGEVRYRDPTQMGKVYLLPAGVERPVPGLAGRDRARRGRPDADARGVARTDPPASRRAQEPVAQPGVRGRDRECLQRRDPARRALLPFRKRSRSQQRRSMPCMRRCELPVAEAIELLRRACPSDVRDAGPRPSRGPQPRRTAVSSLRHQDHRGEGRWASLTSYCRGCQR